MASFDLKHVLDFLSNLERNNDRSWFEAHKAAYEKARLAFVALVDELIRRLLPFEDLPGLTAGDCVLRIYRDIRFSRDKTPYKTWMAALVAKGGRKSGRAGYGLRLAPGDTAAAGGYWKPTPEQLVAFRRSVDRDPGTVRALLEDPEFARTFGELSGERLKRAPQGYANDHPSVDLLMLKQIYVVRPFTDRAVCAGDFVDRLVETFRIMKPFIDYLNNSAP